MIYRYNILAGIHCTINNFLKYQCFPQTQIFRIPGFGIAEMNQKSGVIIHNIFTVFLEALKRLCPEINFHRSGFILNIPNFTLPEIKAFISAVETDVTRIRPSLSVGFEASLPLAQLVSHFNFCGPVTSLIDSFGGLFALGYACNLIAEGRADLFIVGNIDRTETKDIRSFRGSITLAAVSSEKTCNPIGVLEEWAIHAIFNHENNYLGKNLLDLLVWVSDSRISNPFYVSNFDGTVTFFKSGK